VRQVLEHLPAYPSLIAAAEAVARREGLGKETVRRWVVQAQIDGGQRQGATSEELAEIKELKAKVRRLEGRSCAGPRFFLPSMPPEARNLPALRLRLSREEGRAVGQAEDQDAVPTGRLEPIVGRPAASVELDASGLVRLLQAGCLVGGLLLPQPLRVADGLAMAATQASPVHHH
jgi:transposase-like protein